MGLKRLFRKLLSLLPDEIRWGIYRDRARISYDWPSDSLEIKIAETEDELSAAYHLLHDCYVEKGYMQPNQSKMRVLPQHLLPQTTTIVAKWDGVVIGTLSLIRDNPLGLPLEKQFDLSEYRKGGRRVTEVSSLAINPEFRGEFQKALLPLFRYIYIYAKEYFGTHEFVCAVNPDMLDLYCAFVLMEKIPQPARPYDLVNGAVAVGLHFDFKVAEQKYFKIFMGRKANFYNYFVKMAIHPNNKFPARDFHTSTDSVMTPELLTNFFLEKTDVKKQLSGRDLQIIFNSYPALQPGDDIPIATPIDYRENHRFDTQMKARVEAMPMTEVLNVSLAGILIRGSGDLELAQKVNVLVQLNDYQIVRLQCEVSRKADDGTYGLKVLGKPSAWRAMLENLEHQIKLVRPAS